MLFKSESAYHFSQIILPVPSTTSNDRFPIHATSPAIQETSYLVSHFLFFSLHNIFSVYINTKQHLLLLLCINFIFIRIYTAKISIFAMSSMFLLFMKTVTWLFRDFCGLSLLLPRGVHLEMVLWENPQCIATSEMLCPISLAPTITQCSNSLKL